MTFTLRPDQLPLAQEASALMDRGEVPCIVAPTGAGKTVIMAEIARMERAARRRVVAVAHRAEIVDQLCRSLARHMPGERIEIVKAGSRPSWLAPITVAMVPTLSRRLKFLALLEGATLIQDECHHAGATSWENVTRAIHPFRRCGLTATPVRPNGQGLGDEGGFTRLLVGPQPRKLMAAGHLCDYRLFRAEKGSRISSQGLHRRQGDYDTAEMEARVQLIAGRIVPTWLRLNPEGLRTITVAVSVDHAFELAAQFRAAGVPAAAVVGDSSRTLAQGLGNRGQIFEAFRAGTVRVLVACAVVDEGLDVPEATVLQVTRPTTSLRLWRQLCGRVLRPAPGKAHALILDHTDNWDRLPLPDADVEWALHSPPKVENVITKDNPVTGEVTTEPAPVEILESEAELRALERGAADRMTPKAVKAWLAAVVEDAARNRDAFTLRELLPATGVMEIGMLRVMGQALGHPAGWAETQAWFAEMDGKVRSKALAAARDMLDARAGKVA